MDRIELALLGAERTSDTAGVAFLLHVGALVVGAALDKVLCLVRHKLDQMSRAGLRTLSAGHALFLIHDSHAVHHVNGVKLAGLHAASGAEAAVSACLVAGAGNDRNLIAVLNAVIAVLHIGLVAGTLALHESHHFLCTSGLHAHDGRNLVSHRRAANRTCVYRGFPLCDGLSQRITACKAAAAAVISGKLLADEDFLFIYFNLKLLAGNSQKHADDDADRTDENCRDDYTCHIHPSSPPLNQAGKSEEGNRHQAGRN